MRVRRHEGEVFVALASDMSRERVDAADERAILFEEHLNEPFYGGKQFAIRDPNGFVIYFYQE